MPAPRLQKITVKEQQDTRVKLKLCIEWKRSQMMGPFIVPLHDV